MLGRTHRFHGQRGLRQVYQRGINVRGQLITLRYLPHTKPQPYKVAVVVSRQVSKSAVTRNRIRRRLYAQIRQSKHLPESNDLVFTVYNDRVGQLAPDELAATVEGLLHKTQANIRPKA
jgi:ribonuclease P protein component